MRVFNMLWAMNAYTAHDSCSGDIVGADETVPGICSDCLFTCAGGMACKVVSHE